MSSTGHCAERFVIGQRTSYEGVNGKSVFLC